MATDPDLVLDVFKEEDDGQEPLFFRKREVDTILRYAARNGSSDTHFVPGYPVRMEVRGDLVNATYRVMTTDEMDAVIEAAKGIEGPAMIKGGRALSYSYEIPESFLPPMAV